MENRQRSWGKHKWLLLFLLEAADLRKCSNTGLFLCLIPGVIAMVWLCLGGQWNLAWDVSPHLQTLTHPSGCGQGLQGGRSRVPGRSSACCCFPWVWRKHLPPINSIASSLTSSALIPGDQDTIKAFCHPPGFGSCCPMLAAFHLCRPGAAVTTATRPLQTRGVCRQLLPPAWHTTANASLATCILLLTHLKVLRSSFKYAIFLHFSNYC